ncbi:MAG: hypothetical protein EOP06_25875, partial [Proteobacteria bacterium]
MTSDKTRLRYVEAWPAPKSFGTDTLLIYDRFFDGVPSVRKWIAQFPVRYAVLAGENLKDVRRLPEHLEKITTLTQDLASRKMKVVVLGGGSVGDFGGFIASIFKRGVGLVHIPSTWLSAMDSAHGGKTALNVAGAKNQVGTFYPASDVYMIKPLLTKQPASRNFEALGELIKMALLTGGTLFSKMNASKNFDANSLWALLPLVVREKYRIVNEDPLEQSGHRHLLNLGHTIGHVFEAHYRLPHGVAVLAGTQFALEWSYHRGLMSEKDYLKLMRQPFWQKAVSAKLKSPWKDLNMLALLSESPSLFLKYLKQDKKKSAVDHVRFIFVRKPGQPEIQSVHLDEFKAEIARQRSGVFA